jgi:GcrA cell cycle regulator
MSDWPFEDLQRLRQLVADGFSAGQIGEKMGRSRNAIIGKILRADVGKLARSRGKSNGAAPRKQTMKPVKRRIVAPPQLAPAFERPQVYVPATNLPATLPITFLDAVNAKRCLHYVGDPYSPDGPDMPVCGAERSASAGTVPYCRRHFASATRVVSA